MAGYAVRTCLGSFAAHSAGPALQQREQRRPRRRHPMTRITLKLTAQELDLLSSLASDQLFRREFIDPRMPGYRSNPGELSLGKQLVERLRGMTDRAKGVPIPPGSGAAI